MTRDEIIRLAVECQLVTTGQREGLYMDALVQFADAVKRAELYALKNQAPVAWQKAKLKECEHGVVIVGWEACEESATKYLMRPTRPLYTAPSVPAGYPHKWDSAGERCLKCGDKDWMGGPCSVAQKPGESDE